VTQSPQSELFRAGPAAPVDLTPGADHLAEAAMKLPPSLRMGTSSWSFPGWHGAVWDREASERTLARHGLRAYARHPLFRTVGVDRGYYSPVPLRTIRDYASQVGDDFRFVWKADRRLVFSGGPGADPDLFLNPAWADQEILGPLQEGLGEGTGLVLFQFPPLPAHALGGPRPFAERLYRFLDALTTGMPAVVEIRTPEFMTPDYAAALHHGGAAHGYLVHPEMPALPDQAQLLPPAAGRPTLIRWMLQPGYTYSGAREAWSPFTRLGRPDPIHRGQVATLVRRAAALESTTYVVVNNKAEGSAPLSIEALARALVGETDATS